MGKCRSTYELAASLRHIATRADDGAPPLLHLNDVLALWMSPSTETTEASTVHKCQLVNIVKERAQAELYEEAFGNKGDNYDGLTIAPSDDGALPVITATSVSERLRLVFAGRVGIAQTSQSFMCAKARGQAFWVEGSSVTAYTADYLMPAWLVPIAEDDQDAVLDICTTTKQIDFPFGYGFPLQSPLTITITYLAPREASVGKKNSCIDKEHNSRGGGRRAAE